MNIIVMENVTIKLLFQLGKEGIAGGQCMQIR